MTTALRRRWQPHSVLLVGNQGHKQGALEKAREIAKELLDVLDKHTIAEKTGLSLTEIEALEKEQIS